MSPFQLIVVLTIAMPICNCQQKLTNIDYLGLGYDAVYGNPHTDLRDPGFREAVFKLDYSTNSVSSDGKWLIPDNVQALQTFSCGYETDITEIYGSSSYSYTLTRDASISGGFWFASFSASRDFKRVQSGSSKSRSAFVATVAKCLLYQANIQRLAEASVTQQFSKAVEALPTKKDDASYLKFISVYGTHYASSLQMGSKAVIQSEFRQAAWTYLQQINFDVKAAARASFLGFTGGLQYTTTVEQMLAKAFDGNRSSVIASFVGSRPSSDGKWETWLEDTSVSPYPIGYTLRPLTEVLTPQYFPNMNATVLAIKKSLLNSSSFVYCDTNPDCVLPDEDRDPVKLVQVNTAIIKTQPVKCPSGHSLLSCGLDNLQFSTSAESKRSSVPQDTESCQCFSDFGLACLPWCTNAIQGSVVKISGFTKGDFQINCPDQKKVTGCAIDTRAASGDDWYKAFYPTLDGTGCSCSAVYGAQCYATCASNIRNHEILTQYGKGNITVQCSSNNFVLGCGIQPLRSGTAESFRTLFPSSLSSCLCYDRYGATCYAICGQFA